MVSCEMGHHGNQLFCKQWSTQPSNSTHRTASQTHSGQSDPLKVMVGNGGRLRFGKRTLFKRIIWNYKIKYFFCPTLMLPFMCYMCYLHSSSMNKYDHNVWFHEMRWLFTYPLLILSVVLEVSCLGWNPHSSTYILCDHEQAIHFLKP